MKILIFFSRIALICNICFVFAHFLRYEDNLQMNAVFSTVVMLGYGSLILNLILAISLIALMVFRRTMLKIAPRWLFITNFLFLIAQLFIFLS